MMKKISSFLLVLFLVFFLWPRGVLAATACCLPNYEYDGSRASCCKKGNNCSLFDHNYDDSKWQCGSYTCDKSSQQCTQIIQSTDPECPGGYLQEAGTWAVCSQFAGVCCSKDSTGFFCDRTGTCGAGNGFCDCFQKSVKDTKPKNFCSNAVYRYNPDTNKCEKFVEKKWDLIQDCGNKTKTVSGADHYDGVSTAIGCVPVENLTDFLKFVLKWVFFASGGIIVLMVIATGYTIITSQGNPEKLQGAKENIVALLSGLAMIAFSLILLQVIGANILGLPTF